ncbi:MAG TPA: DUF3592 domain-containing protein [Cyclobacteriaceae bacterium]|nr:DUF3592 domain-containing protein [Cyclobacteriaceae bacterium]
MRSLFFFFGIFAFVGTIMLVLTLWFGYLSLKKVSSWESAPATLTGFAGGGNPTIEFSYHGQKRQFNSSFTSSDMEIGEKMEVHFPAGNPNEAEIKNFFNLWFLPLFFSIFALTFGGVGFYGVSKQLKKMGAKRELFDEQKGKRLNLAVTEVSQDFSYKVNGRSPYIIVSQWINPLTQEVHEFKSDYYWYNPEALLSNHKNVDVYVDENDPTRYYMDTSFLPKKG